MTRAERLRQFQQRLLRWFGRAGRDLPWRKTRDPYHILVSEIMLHQTQVDRVAPKYTEFLAKYPTLRTLAAAPLQELRRTWRPLGYNYRPARLRTIAREALARYGGRLPDSAGELMTFDGVGRYTAGAIMSFAYEQDAPVVDTNIRRVLSRVFGVSRRGRPADVERRVWRLASDVIPPGKGYAVNQALMDFGALVCTARAPQCAVCAMQRCCAAYPALTRTRRPTARRTVRPSERKRR